MKPNMPELLEPRGFPQPVTTTPGAMPEFILPKNVTRKAPYLQELATLIACWKYTYAAVPIKISWG
jgi:hypothetical protein